jgi:hypothetical protein
LATGINSGLSFTEKRANTFNNLTDPLAESGEESGADEYTRADYGTFLSVEFANKSY